LRLGVLRALALKIMARIIARIRIVADEVTI
jgi:hypothetical protein